ncbi:MAG: hypothetical protein IPO83_06340 [Chitinophagaceae bacterium]|nr:hypothetical protein [Chitinophagaceae bacterium]
MKTITLLLAGFLTIGSQTVFADSMDYIANCCPVTDQAGTTTVKSQQMILDQLQFESETILTHSGAAVHEQVQKKVILESESHESMSSMQEETENITVGALQTISQKAIAHVTRTAGIAGK